MLKNDADEASGIVNRMLTSILTWIATRGISGSEVRSACGDLMAKSTSLCQKDLLGPPLAHCFELARLAGITMAQLAIVRNSIVAEKTVLLGATLVKNAGIGMCIATEGRILADAVFVSRSDVDAALLLFNAAFAMIEETAADEMDQMSYQATINLHSAITRFLVDSARPLPRMLRYRFSSTLSTLVAAQQLYYDASRADELRAENKIVHPAFTPLTGQALSA